MYLGIDFIHALMYNKSMNRLKIAFQSRSLTPSGVAKAGLSLTTVQKHYYGSREVGPLYALKYERVLGIPRSELRPDLWPPDGITATPTTPPAGVSGEGGDDAA